MKLACKAGLTLATLLAGTSAALAESPVGFWTVHFFSEPSLAETATHGICFKPNHTLYVTDFPFQGGWFNEGDGLRWYGVASSTAVADADQFITKKLITGTFDEFALSDGSTVNNGNEALAFVSSTCPPPPSSAAAPHRTLTK